MNYYFQKTIEKDFESINLKIRENLSKNGFGILTEPNLTIILCDNSLKFILFFW